MSNSSVAAHLAHGDVYGNCSSNCAMVCNDGNACTVEQCNEEDCLPSVPENYDDKNACTIDGCNPATGCMHTAVNCDDSNACTIDGCNPAMGCTHTAVNCDDSNVCAIDGCNPATGCTNTFVLCPSVAVTLAMILKELWPQLQLPCLVTFFVMVCLFPVFH